MAAFFVMADIILVQISGSGAKRRRPELELQDMPKELSCYDSAPAEAGCQAAGRESRYYCSWNSGTQPLVNKYLPIFPATRKHLAVSNRFNR
jgi:hypothetical protein